MQSFSCPCYYSVWLPTAQNRLHSDTIYRHESALLRGFTQHSETFVMQDFAPFLRVQQFWRGFVKVQEWFKAQGTFHFLGNEYLGFQCPRSLGRIRIYHAMQTSVCKVMARALPFKGHRLLKVSNRELAADFLKLSFSFLCFYMHMSQFTNSKCSQWNLMLNLWNTILVFQPFAPTSVFKLLFPALLATLLLQRLPQSQHHAQFCTKVCRYCTSQAPPYRTTQQLNYFTNEHSRCLAMKAPLTAPALLDPPRVAPIASLPTQSTIVAPTPR